MLFDIVFLILLIVFMSIGYRKGLVSILLSIGALVVAFLLAFYVSYRWTLIDYPVFGLWLQVFLLFVVFLASIRFLVKQIKFEDIALVGWLSRLLGAVLYGLLFTLVVCLLSVALWAFAPQIPQTYFANSFVLAYMRQLWDMLQASMLQMLHRT